MPIKEPNPTPTRVGASRFSSFVSCLAIEKVAFAELIPRVDTNGFKLCARRRMDWILVYANG